MTWRLLGVLIRFLPSESATKTALRESLPAEEYAAMSAQSPERGVHGPWSRTEMLLAQLIDAARVGNWQFVLANLKEGAQQPAAPEPVRRPGVEPGVTRRPSLAAVGRLEARHRIGQDDDDPDGVTDGG